MVDRMRHRLPLRPRVFGGIVLVYEAGRLESGQEPLRSVELAANRNAEQLSGRLG
jgi:hypothetical protein